MLKDYQNKQLKKEEVKEKSIFNFPEYGVSIEADTYEEALKKLEDIIKTNNK